MMWDDELLYLNTHNWAWNVDMCVLWSRGYRLIAACSRVTLSGKPGSIFTRAEFEDMWN